ncbi:MAG: SpoIID/LytB domain-containing protein [Treponema sp.]|jgi:SpoIID/LytB domain protein|nr:SpoIID/LytB domain-containing protein [Treponema sp.]
MSFSAAALPFTLPSISDQEALDFYYHGNVERSIQEFERLFRLEPENVPIRWELIRIYYETGEVNRGTVLLEQLYKEKPADPEVERELFLTFCLTRNTQKALAMLPLSRETGETLFCHALLRQDMGDTSQSIQLLRRSLEIENFRPLGWFILGELLALSAPKEAETCFRTALRQDPELRSVYFPLGTVLLALKQYKEAYTYLNRANQSFPNNNLILQSLNEAARHIPESERPPRAPARVAERRKITAPPPRVKALTQAGLTMVRIGLAEKQSLIAIKTGGPYVLRGPSKAILFSGDESEQLWVEMRNGKILIQDQRERNLVMADKSVSLEYPDPSHTTILSGFTAEDRAYRGSLEFRINQGSITIINSLNIEEYLYGVIPAEMPASWHSEALKAQAIAARSYTLAYLGQYKEKGFDLYGSVLSAAYRGVTGEAPRTTAAVDGTRGMYLKAGGKPLRAYYSANHGGYSEDTVSVWGAYTYNQAVPDKLVSPRLSWLPLNDLARWIREKPKTYSSVANLHSSQAYRWEKWVSAEEIHSRNAGYGRIGEILQITSRGRGVSGRINEIEIKGTLGAIRIKGDLIRSRLGGLRSNLFTIRSKIGDNGKPEYFIFQGAGWGHGVGLDQSGAAGMAHAGFTASQILGHYYPLAELAGR